MWRKILQTRPRHVEDMLSAYLDGELSPEQKAQVEEHLRICPQCAWNLETLRRTVEILRELPAALPPRSFTFEEKPKAFMFSPIYPYLKWSTVAVAFLLIVVLTGGTFLMLSQAPAKPFMPLMKEKAPPVLPETAPVAGEEVEATASSVPRLPSPIPMPLFKAPPEGLILGEEAAPPAAPLPAFPEPTLTPTEKPRPAPTALEKAQPSLMSLWLWTVFGLSLALVALGTATWLVRTKKDKFMR